ncbi:hypothetical protein ACFL59_03485 [Planctomycetota bacterium]
MSMQNRSDLFGDTPLKRLAEGRCPIHGLFMYQESPWLADDDGLEYTLVGCPRDDCAVLARARACGSAYLVEQPAWLVEKLGGPSHELANEGVAVVGLAGLRPEETAEAARGLFEAIRALCLQECAGAATTRCTVVQRPTADRETLAIAEKTEPANRRVSLAFARLSDHLEARDRGMTDARDYASLLYLEKDEARLVYDAVRRVFPEFRE